MEYDIAKLKVLIKSNQANNNYIFLKVVIWTDQIVHGSIKLGK